MAGVLLLGADYYGTLAAARCYGQNGIHVAMADDNPRARGLYSKHVKERLVHPPLAEPQALLDWLVAYGERHPETVLYPPNDHLSWLFAANRDQLGKVFQMYEPSEAAIIGLLDKKRMHDACAAVSIDVPDTRAAGDPKIGFPVLLKPRTQVFLEGGIKGFIVENRETLEGELAKFHKLVKFNRVLTDRHPDIAEPMVQEYLTAAETSIFSVSGFVTKTGDVVARAAMKVLQRPRKVGIGLCFEGRALEPVLVEKIAALSKHLGYFGCFESEFIVDGDRRLLIDFNPRFYSQMGFDIARGLPLPMLVWHAARGEEKEFGRVMERAKAWKPAGTEAYCHKTMLDIVLGLQGISGQMSRADVKHWRSWYREHAVTDAIRDPADRKPSMIDSVQWLRHFAKHPRSFVRSFVLNR